MFKGFQDSKTRWAWRRRLWRSWGINLLGFSALWSVISATYYGVVEPIWIIGAIAMYTLFRVEQMRQKHRSSRSDKYKFQLEAKPGPPRHEAPEPPSASSWWSGGARYESNCAFFRDFAGFGDAMNDMLQDGPWRLHQRADTEVITSPESMSFGLRYWVSHGQALIGTVEIYPDFITPEYNCKVYAHIELFPDAIQMGFNTVWDLLETIASWIASGSRDEYLNARDAIRHDLLAILWDARLDDEPKDIDLTFSGTANVRFFERYAAAA
jgi:hypothetical protein